MGKLTKAQRKADTKAKTSTAMKLADQIGKYNTYSRDLGTVMDMGNRAHGQGDAPAFARGVVAERGLDDEAGALFSGSTDSGSLEENQAFDRSLRFSASEMREDGGKAGFKLVGKTEYGKILSAFQAYEKLGERTKEEVAAKHMAAGQLQAMAGNWRDKHGLQTGGSGKEDEARKAAAVMRLYTHMQVEQRRLRQVESKAASQQELDIKAGATAFGQQSTPNTGQLRSAQWKNHQIGQDRSRDLQMVQDTSRQTMLDATKTVGEDGKVTQGDKTKFDAIRGTTDASKTLSAVGGPAGLQHVLSKCYGPLMGRVRNWKALAGNPQNLAAYDSVSQCLKPEIIAAAVQESFTAAVTGIPQEILDVVIAHMQGMEGFNVTEQDEVTVMDKNLLAGNAMMLRLLTPGFANLVRAIQDQVVDAADKDRDPVFLSLRLFAASVQGIANGMRTTDKNAVQSQVQSMSFGAMSAQMNTIGAQIMAAVQARQG